MTNFRRSGASVALGVFASTTVRMGKFGLFAAFFAVNDCRKCSTSGENWNIVALRPEGNIVLDDVKRQRGVGWEERGQH